MELFGFIAAIPYLEEVLTFLLAFHAAALVLVNFTDTPADNKMLALVYRYIEFFAGIIRASKVKQPNPTDAKNE